jgi:DNA-damage-inducible protein J
MAETRLSVRVDDTIKRQAEAVFHALGMNLSTGVNVFLTRVAHTRSIPFALELSGGAREKRMREAVKTEIAKAKDSGAPVALFDDEQNLPYLEYPDGRKLYEIG